MAKVANLREQTILEVFIMGLRIQDARSLEWKWFDVVDQEPPIALDLMTKKEKQIAKSFISEELLDILKKYLPTLKKENKYSIQTSKNGKIDEEALNKILKRLAKRAGINLRGSLIWHEGRRLFLRVASEQGINQWSARMLVGKAVPKDILAYVNGVELRNDFLKISKVLRLRSERGNGRITNIEQLVDLMLKAWKKIIMEEIEQLPVKAITGIALEQMSPEELLKLFVES